MRAEPIRLKTVGPLAWDRNSFQNEREYNYKLSMKGICEIGEALKNSKVRGVFCRWD
jgi:hypothetical protein